LEGDVQSRQRLLSRKAAIVDRWCELTLGVYPPESFRLMRREKDRFQNPVGRVTHESLESLFDGLVEDRPADEMADALDGIVRIRAVQDLSPSTALAFLFQLKDAIREACGEEVPVDAAFDARIERLVLQAFDLFSSCRGKIQELRIKEIKNRASVLLERMGELPTKRSDGPAACGPCDNVNGGCEV
jgi:hypothetical protein